MKKYLGILLFFVSSLVFSQTDSYILTIENEKIPIDPNSSIVSSSGGKVFCDKPLKNGKKRNPNGTQIGGQTIIRGRRITKIVDGDKLYLPFYFYNEKRKVMYRLVAQNDRYKLGFLYHRMVDRNNIFVINSMFIVLDEKNQVVDRELVTWESYNKDITKRYTEEDKKASHEGIRSKLAKYFGDCLDREEYYDYLKTIKKSAKASFVPRKMEDVEKREFLYKTNQLICE